VEIAELDRESAELLPDRQALGCWNYGGHGWQRYGGYTGISLSLNPNVTSQFGGFWH
jgi:hypothetical protein